LLIGFSLTLLLALQATLVKGGTDPQQTTFSPQKLLTASPLNTSVFHPVDLDQDSDSDIFSGDLVDGQLLWYENRGLSETTFTIHTLPTAFEDV
jgi:hypothetical protein